MSDEFQLGSGGNWWDGTRNRYDSGSTAPASTTALNNTFGWHTEMADIKARSSLDSSASSSVSGRTSMGGGHVFPTDSHTHRLQLQGHDSSSGPGVNLLTDPNLHMMGLGLSSQTMDWNQAIFNRGEKAETSFRSMLQEDEGQGNGNFQQDSQEQWRHKLLFGGSSSGEHHQDDSSITHHDHFKQFNRPGGLSLDQPQYSSSQSSNNNNSTTTTTTNFQVVDSAAAPPPYGGTSTPNVVQGLMLVSSDHNSNNNSDNHNHQTQSAFDHTRSLNYSYPPAAAAATYAMINTAPDHQFFPSNSSWSKFPPFLRTSSSPPPPSAKQPPAHGQLHFSNNTPFWNAISTPNNITTDARSSFFPSLHQTQQLATSSSFEEKPKQSTSEVRDLTKKTSSSSSNTTEASNKRSRNETTPSPMPAFKVRKEKMGDRITALQQLVSPFGKTDTASVLSEAIEYIKFLHEQVSVLSTPYMKSGAHVQQHPAQIPHDKSKDPEGPKQDLRSRGLCLVPVPSTFPVMNESNFDFWNPTFGGTYR